MHVFFILAHFDFVIMLISSLNKYSKHSNGLGFFYNSLHGVAFVNHWLETVMQYFIPMTCKFLSTYLWILLHLSPHLFVFDLGLLGR